MSDQIKFEPKAEYSVNNDEDFIIERALEILNNRLRRPGETMNSTDTTKKYLYLKLVEREHEVFSCLFLDNRHRVIAFEEIFRGTIDGASVYPREVVKAAMKHNAAAVVFAHNHPSGLSDPSNADKNITNRLKESLALIDVRVLDHVIVGSESCTSFAEMGYL